MVVAGALVVVVVGAFVVVLLSSIATTQESIKYMIVSMPSSRDEVVQLTCFARVTSEAVHANTRESFRVVLTHSVLARVARTAVLA